MKKPKIEILGEIHVDLEPKEGEYRRIMKMNEELSTEVLNEMIDALIEAYNCIDSEVEVNAQNYIEVEAVYETIESALMKAGVEL